MKKITALILVLALALTGCVESSDPPSDLMENINARVVNAPPDCASGAQAVTDFGVRLMQNSFESGRNLLISPLSVLCALAMTANGAKEQTRAQMEEAFGLSLDELNSYLRWYAASLPQGEDYSLRLANSIWLNDDLRFKPEQDFLQRNADFYGADIYTVPFDASARDAVNDWVADKTDGMIEEILDQIPEDTMLYLINALAFDAKWASVYETHDVRDGVFTKEDGAEQDVELMYATENRYLTDELATGFIKYYEDRSYAFVALLPREGVTVEEYIASLTGERLRSLLDNVQNTVVITAIPKFEAEYSIELSQVLKDMGMTDAFDRRNADFSGLGRSADGNIFISRVLHKTYISVGEQGTKAGAATVVEMPDATGVQPDKRQEVILDRPFVYLLADCENSVAFFVGAVMDVEQ